jgi:hypothetical protein
MIENKQGSDLFFPILSLLFGLTWKKSTLKYGRIPIEKQHLSNVVRADIFCDRGIPAEIGRGEDQRYVSKNGWMNLPFKVLLVFPHA